MLYECGLTACPLHMNMQVDALYLAVICRANNAEERNGGVDDARQNIPQGQSAS